MKELHGYQLDCVLKLCAGAREDLGRDGPPRELVATLPTGSGKGLIMRSVAGLLMKSGHVRRTVILCPQKQIADSVAKAFRETVSCGGDMLTGLQVLEPKKGKILRLSEAVKTGTSEEDAMEVHKFCHASVRTSDCWGRVDARGILMLLDEFHHASNANRLGWVVAAFREAGGLVMKTSATPDRHDGRKTMPDPEESVLYSRSMAEHMEQGYAPRILESKIISVGDEAEPDAGDDVSVPKLEDGEEDVSALCSEMADEYVRLGRPKLICQFRTYHREWNKKVLRGLIEAFVEHGVERSRIYDATDVLESRRKGRELSEILDWEERAAEDPKLGYAASRYDVIIGIQRVTEGTNWPMCSAVFRIGLPKSLPFFRQLLGRAFRDKRGIHGYPEEWADRSLTVLFVAGLREAGEAHSRHTLLTAVFLSSVSLSQEHWSLFRQLNRVMEDFPEVPGIEATRGGGVGTVLPNPDELVRARAYVLMANEALTEGLRRLHPDMEAEITFKMLQQGAKEIAKDEDLGPVGGAALRAAVLERLASQNDRASEELTRRLGEAATRAPGGLSAKDLDRCIRETLREFREDTLRPVPGRARYVSQLHELSGDSMERYARRYADRMPLSRSTLLSEVERHASSARRGAKRWPNPMEEPWRTYDASLKRGTRGLEAGKRPGGLKHLVHEAYWHSRAPMTWTDVGPSVTETPSPEQEYFPNARRLYGLSRDSAELVRDHLKDVLQAEEAGKAVLGGRGKDPRAAELAAAKVLADLRSGIGIGSALQAVRIGSPGGGKSPTRRAARRSGGRRRRPR